jgi:hypothetical protein
LVSRHSKVSEDTIKALLPFSRNPDHSITAYPNNSRDITKPSVMNDYPLLPLESRPSSPKRPHIPINRNNCCLGMSSENRTTMPPSSEGAIEEQPPSLDTKAFEHLSHEHRHMTSHLNLLATIQF